VSIVVDASVALKWVLDEAGSDAAISLRTQDLIAPNSWLAEATNALWRSARIGQITQEEATACLAELVNAPIASLPMELYLERGLKLAMESNHPAYDCIYLAVALHHGTHVVTADRRFAALANLPELADRVRLLEA